MSSRKGIAAVAARMDSGVGLNPSLDLLGVVLASGTNSKQVHKVTRHHLVADFGTDEKSFQSPSCMRPMGVCLQLGMGEDGKPPDIKVHASH